jgi:hypothetical protein
MEGQRRKTLSRCADRFSACLNGVETDQAMQLHHKVILQLNTAPAYNLASEARLIEDAPNNPATPPTHSHG